MLARNDCLFTQTFSVYIQSLLIQLLGFLYSSYFFTYPQNILYQIKLVKNDFPSYGLLHSGQGAVIWVVHVNPAGGNVNR